MIKRETGVSRVEEEQEYREGELDRKGGCAESSSALAAVAASRTETQPS
jgi:hypothetical protein